jgi:beta-xylosidase
MRNIGVSILLPALLLLFACDPPPPKQIILPTPTPSPINGSPVTKNTNVSFNTYSKEWPVEWQWIDPDPHPPTGHDTRMAVLQLLVPKGKDLNLERNTAPRYLKAIAGDFEIETKVVARPVLNHQGAGLIVWLSEKDYILFQRASTTVSGIEVIVRNGDDMIPLATTNVIPTDVGETWLRICREGANFSFLWRDSARTAWREAARYTSDYPPSILTGLVATNTGDELEVDFPYIRLEPLKR